VRIPKRIEGSCTTQNQEPVNLCTSLMFACRASIRRHLEMLNLWAAWHCPGDGMALDTGRETFQFTHLDPGATADLGVW
jgi:hypothetical protein